MLLIQPTNIVASIIDCVGCEKCKLWGKLQILGIATSLKVLFSEAPLNRNQIEVNERKESLILHRNEMIAMINTLTRFSASLKEIKEMDRLLMLSTTDASTINEDKRHLFQSDNHRLYQDIQEEEEDEL